MEEFASETASVLVSAGHMKFILLHSKANEDGVRNFLQDANEAYLKVL